MGRSKSKRQTRSSTSNQRLRSDPYSQVQTPQTVPYLSTAMVRDYLKSPSLTPSNYLTSVLYAPRVNPPSQPPRSNGLRGSKLRTYTPPVAASSKAVSNPSRNPEDRKAMVCVRRSERREVLHATQKTGQSGQKSPVYNWQSKINCKGRK